MSIPTVDVLNVDVAEGRSGNIDRFGFDVVHLLTAFQHFDNRLSAVVEVESNGVALDVEHGNVVNEDVLNHATTPTATLEAKTDIGAEELAIGHMDVFHTTTHFRTHYKASMSCKYGATVYHHILTRFATLASILVLTALDADSVVASIELAVHDERILARLQVECIAVLCVARIAGKHTVDDDVLAHEWMDVPGWGVLEDDTL